MLTEKMMKSLEENGAFIDEIKKLTGEIRRQRAQIKKLKRKVETLKEALR